MRQILIALRTHPPRRQVRWWGTQLTLNEADAAAKHRTVDLIALDDALHREISREVHA